MSVASLITHVVIFALGFTLEIRVHAAQAAAPAVPREVERSHYSPPVQIAQAEAPLQEPQGCVITKQACAIRTDKNEKFEFALADGLVTLDRGSAIVRETDGLVRLIDGTVWIRAKAPILIRSEYGDAKLESGGEMWVTREEDRIVISAPSNDVVLKPRGSSEDILVVAGTQNYLGRVERKTGSAETGIPVAIQMREHIERWARLFPGNSKDFQIAVRSFHGRWSSATEKTAALHKEQFERRVASVEAEKARQAERSRKREVEDKKLRDLFRKKVFEGL